MGKANPYMFTFQKNHWPKLDMVCSRMCSSYCNCFFSAVQITNTFEGLTTEQHNYVITGIFASFFLVWYVLIRSIILKKKILR